MNILGIRRDPRFSPNSVDRDAAIFSSVVTQLLRKGHEVSVMGEDLLFAADFEEFDMVFSMARSNEAIASLATAENELHIPVFNSALSLQKASRAKITQVFAENSIPQPKSQLISLGSMGNEGFQLGLKFPLWLKNGGLCTQDAIDVSFVSDESGFRETVSNVKHKDIDILVAEEHKEGDLIKFYGVEGTDFFFYTYATENKGFSKFGLEKHNGIPQHYDFDLSDLKKTANQAASLIGFTVYGGDAIVQSDGTFYIIDFNDWPSFSTCRRAAAKAIAHRICEL